MSNLLGKVNSPADVQRLSVPQLTELAEEIRAFAYAPSDEMIHAGDFVDGVMAVSRTSIMLGADALIQAIDDLLKSAPWEIFLAILPRLRAAFERLHDRQCDSLAERFQCKRAGEKT